MNTKRIVTLTLILTLSLVCLLNYSVASYPEGAWDLTTIATKSTLEATHIVVGEVTHVSFVFYYVGADPLSIVTLRVDKDIKTEIEKDNTPPKYLPPPFILIGTPLGGASASTDRNSIFRSGRWSMETWRSGKSSRVARP